MNRNPINIGQKDFLLNCGCHCSSLGIRYWEDGDCIIISHNIPSFSAFQKTNWEKFKEKLLIIWSVLRNEEYKFYEITIDTKEDVRKFKEFIAQIDESKLIFDE